MSSFPLRAVNRPQTASTWGRWMVAKGLGLVTAAGCVWAVYINDGEPASIASGLGSVPRAVKTIAWYTHAAAAYKAHRLQYPERTEASSASLSALHSRLAPSLLHLCEANGGVYIKAAQLATTVLAVPQEYRAVLQKLQDDVSPRHPADLNSVFQRQFHQPLEALYAEFEQQPCAAASLAQVHRARLWTGEDVAVKVQYAGLTAAVAADLTVLTGLARAAEWLFPDGFRFQWILAELRRNLAAELDFRVEAANSERVRTALSTCSSIIVPAVIPQLSGAKILTMQWMEGCKLTDSRALEAAKLRPRDVGNVLLEVFARMQYEAGWIHGDAHSGNLLVRPIHNQRWWQRWLGGGWQRPELILLDHGLYISLPDQLRLDWCQLWSALVINDMTTAAKVASRLVGEQSAGLLPVLLKPGGLGSLTKQDRAQLRRKAGLETIGDLGKLLEQLPRELTSVFRITAAIRSQASALGSTLADRLRINAVHALQGMSITRVGTEGSSAPIFIGDLRSRMTRLRVQVYIWALRAGFWASHVAASAWHCLSIYTSWISRSKQPDLTSAP